MDICDYFMDIWDIHGTLVELRGIQWDTIGYNGIYEEMIWLLTGFTGIFVGYLWNIDWILVLQVGTIDRDY
jgi:hypothetical protein